MKPSSSIAGTCPFGIDRQVSGLPCAAVGEIYLHMLVVEPSSFAIHKVRKARERAMP